MRKGDHGPKECRQKRIREEVGASNCQRVRANQIHCCSTITDITIDIAFRNNKHGKRNIRGGGHSGKEYSQDNNNDEVQANAVEVHDRTPHLENKSEGGRKST